MHICLLTGMLAVSLAAMTNSTEMMKEKMEKVAAMKEKVSEKREVDQEANVQESGEMKARQPEKRYVSPQSGRQSLQPQQPQQQQFILQNPSSTASSQLESDEVNNILFKYFYIN